MSDDAVGQSTRKKNGRGPTRKTSEKALGPLRVKENPPTQAVDELDALLKSSLYKYIAKKTFDEIPKLFKDCSPQSKKLIEEWHSLITNVNELASLVFEKAKVTLKQFIEDERKLNNEIAKAQYPLTGPKVSEVDMNQQRDSRLVSTESAVTAQSHQNLDSHYDTTTVKEFSAQTAMPKEPIPTARTSVPSQLNTTPLYQKNVSQSKVVQNFDIQDVHPKNVYNILLLGETGVGKTTFINSFANYVKYNSLDEALQETPIILMDTSFSATFTPNEARLTLGLRNCLDNLLVKLHRDATKNILFCFTNTRSTMYRPGDTMAPLGEYLNELEKNTGVVIKTGKHNLFCFDNDCFRYLCVLMQLPKSKNEKTHKILSDGWEHNVSECKNLLARIQGMVAHQVEDTVNVNNTRKLLIAIAQPLTEVAQNHLVNKKMVEAKIREIEELGRTGRYLSEKVEHRQLIVVKIPLEKHRTVCTSVQCNDIVHTEDGTPYQKPKKICHDNCHLNETENKNDRTLYNCAAFDVRKHCTICKCHVREHKHMKYELIRKMETTIDYDVQAQLFACKDHKQKAEIVVTNLKNKLQNIEHEYSLIKESSIEFSAFLKYNSVKAGVDPYFEYLDQMIGIEENKANHGGDKILVIELKTMLKQYKDGVNRVLDDIKDKIRPPLSSNELNKKIENLGHMKLSGELIEQIVNESRHAPEEE